jgi:tetratricopeptide (TPR) repeat protein
MNQTHRRGPKYHSTVEARRLTELARAAGFGDTPDDALEWNRQLVELLGSDDETTLLADVLRWQGSVYRDRGRTSEADPLYRRSFDVSSRLGYDAGRAHALNCLASLAQRRGDMVMTEILLTDALTLARQCDETQLVGMIHQNLGIVADIRGNPGAALAHYRTSLRTFESTNDLQPMCWVLNNLGYLYLKEEQFVESREALDRALGIARARGDLMAEGIIEENRAELRLMRGEMDEAQVSIDRALEISVQREDDVRRGAALKQRGAYERMSGRPDAAADTLRVALTLSAVGEDALLGAEILYQFGLALNAAGDSETAKDVWQAALEAFERIGARQWAGRTSKRLSHGGTSRYL